MKNKNLKKAFTLVELLVVISVIAVLLSIAIPKIKGMQQNSQVIKTHKEISIIVGALEAYATFGATHTYPPSTTSVQASYLIIAYPELIKTVLYDPFAATTTTEYNYLCSSNGKYFIVWSVGLSGQNQPTAISNTGIVSY